jgi:hypothetical protein
MLADEDIIRTPIWERQMLRKSGSSCPVRTTYTDPLFTHSPLSLTHANIPFSASCSFSNDVFYGMVQHHIYL